MNFDQMKFDAEAALAHCDKPYEIVDFSRLDKPDQQHYFNCSPANMLKLLAVVKAARQVVKDSQDAGGHISLFELDAVLTALDAP